MQGGGDAAAQPPPVPPSALPQPSDSAASASAPATQAGDATVEGDTNHIADPKCVGTSAATLLSSDAPLLGPTCGPMKQPPELQKAEQ